MRRTHTNTYPLCPACCQEITDEFCLDLRPFGIAGYACEVCVSKFLGYTQDLKEVDDYV